MTALYTSYSRSLARPVLVLAGDNSIGPGPEKGHFFRVFRVESVARTARFTLSLRLGGLEVRTLDLSAKRRGFDSP